MSYLSDFENLINNKSNYVAEGIGSFTIDGISYTEYSDYTFWWEKTYVKQPERSSDGSMGNLDTYSTFLTPHLIVNYDKITIDAYRSIMNQFLSKNEFEVTCYDTINNKMTTNKMYFATPSMPKYFYKTEEDKNVEVLGVHDYTIELIGTNNK